MTDNAAAKALVDNGVSIWLDDLSRDRIETGNLQELIDTKGVVGVTTNPSIFQAALAKGDRYDADLRAHAAQGADRRRDGLRPDDGRRPHGVRHLPARSTTPPTASTAGSRSRSTRALAHDTGTHRRAGQAALRRRRPAQRAHQDPGHGRGTARDLPGARRGHQRQRHADLLPRPLPRRDERLPHRPRAGPRGRPRPVRRSTRSPRSSSPASTARSTSASTPSRATAPRREVPQGQGRRRQRAAGLPGLRGGLLDAALAEPRRRRRPPAAPAVGLHRSQGPGLLRHALRHRAGRPGHRQHHAGEDPRRGRSTTARSPATRSRAATPTPAQVLDELEELGISYADVDRPARARGRRRSSRRRGASCSTRRSATSTWRARTSSRPTSERAGGRRLRSRRGRHRQPVPELVEAAVRQQALRPGRHALGPGRRVGVGHPAVLGQPAPLLAPAASARSPRCATSSRAEGRRPRRPVRHGRLVAGARGHLRHGRGRPRRPRLLRPRHGPQRPDRPRAHGRRRLQQVRLHRRDRLASAGPSRRRSPSAGIDPTEPHRRRHRPRQPARRGVPRGGLPRRQRRPQRRRPLLGPDRVRAGARPASPAPTSRRCSTTPRPWPTCSAPTTTPTPALRLGAAIGRHLTAARQAGPRRRRLGHRRLRRLGRAAHRRVAPASSGTGILPVVVGGDRPRGALAGRRRHRRPAGRRRRRDDRAARHRGARRPLHRGRSAGRSAPRCCCGRSPSAAAGRLLGINPFDQPDVESAKKAARALLDRASARPTTRPPPTAPSRSAPLGGDWLGGATTVAGALDALLRPARRRPRLRRRHGLPRPAGRRRRSPRARRGSPGAPSDRRPSAGDRASCTPPASSTRAGPPTGVYLQVTTTPHEDLDIPGRRLHLRRVHRGPGRR